MQRTLDHPLPKEIFRMLSDSPSRPGVVILRAPDGKPLSPHAAKDMNAFLSWITYARNDLGFTFSFEIYENPGDAVERCNKIIAKLS